ncbi:MAG: YdeI/OmpD-associated family protein [Bacteroidia bacterium]|nr:YdeI/OmpD-associated family protein [Bacteroidia bacterium]
MRGFSNPDEYFANQDHFAAEQLRLREIFLKTELKEEMKWGGPIYTLKGKNVAAMGAFKSYVGIWFHQGVFLKDPAKVLINAQEGVTKALRQWRFDSMAEIDEKLILEYLAEAIQNMKEGKVMKPQPKPLLIPLELENALKKDAVLNESFESLSQGCKKEYAGYILEAKREETRLARVEKIIPMILKKVGLNDRYK